MSSREIAELTGKMHTNVLRDIRNMLADLRMTELTFESSYRDSTGRSLPEFRLPKDLTITLVSGYSVPMRHRIVTRWMELEAGNTLIWHALLGKPIDCSPAPVPISLTY